MKLAIFVAALGLVGPSLSSAQALEFKGVSLGDSQEKVQAAGFDCRKDTTPLGDMTCGTPMGKTTTIAGYVTRSVQIYLLDGQVASIYASFHSANFDDVSAAVAEKYGPAATVEQPSLQTRAGVTYTNKVMGWTRPGGTMDVKKYAGAIDTGSLLISADGYNEKVQARRKGAAQKNSKDL